LTLPALRFRCAGTAAVGLGHVVRSMALAEAARARGCRDIRFVMRPDAAATALPAAAGFEVESAPDGDDGAALAARAPGGAWFVLDGYDLGPLVAPLRARGLGVCAIDDAPGGTPGLEAADLRVNPRLDASAPQAETLVGPRFAPLRCGFRRRRLAGDRGRAAGALRIALLSGGSDVAGLAVRALSALRALAPACGALEAVVVVGPAAPAVEGAVARLRGPGLAVQVVRAPDDLPALMAAADVAVTAAGTSVLELLCLGVPPILVTVADNQAGIAAAVARAGAGIDLGGPDAVAPAPLGRALGEAVARRDELARAGRRLVDGGGARRVMAALSMLNAGRRPCP
jgi:spore coat polysaccharide biosynthesis predicted glycosyltransferase SpsG